MKKEIEIMMRLTAKWRNDNKSLTEAIEYCMLAIRSYSTSNSFEGNASIRRYTYCKKMLELVKLNNGELLEVTNKPGYYVAFRIAFGTSKDYNRFDDSLTVLTNSTGYTHPVENSD